MSESGPKDKDAKESFYNPLPEKGELSHKYKKEDYVIPEGIFLNFEVKENEKSFLSKLNSLPQEVQDLISSLSSSFLENDVKQQFKENPKNIQFVKDTLQEFHLSASDINVVFNILGLNEGSVKK
jgi:hypothetical protein